jgi:hypothetical protein
MPWHVGINFVKRVAQIFKLGNYGTQILPCDFTTVSRVSLYLMFMERPFAPVVNSFDPK